MKTMTCQQMGGPCDAEMKAGTEEEMVSLGMGHINEAHPDLAESVKAMTDEEKAAWRVDFQKKWDETPEDGEEEAA